MVELKAVKELDDGNREQCINYIHASQSDLGLLINFGEASLIGERWAYDAETNECFIVDRYMEPISDADYVYLLDTDGTE